jgi:hypothetical protein
MRREIYERFRSRSKTIENDHASPAEATP